MKTVWTEHLKTEGEKTQFANSLKHCKWVLERLNDILSSMERGYERQERSPRAYDLPNWENRQAHGNGWMQCMHQIKDLINLDHKEQDGKPTTA